MNRALRRDSPRLVGQLTQFFKRAVITLSDFSELTFDFRIVLDIARHRKLLQSLIKRLTDPPKLAFHAVIVCSVSPGDMITPCMQTKVLQYFRDLVIWHPCRISTKLMIGIEFIKPIGHVNGKILCVIVR